MIAKRPFAHPVLAAVVASLPGLTSAARAAAPEVVDADGRASPGAVAVDDAGRIRFTPTGQAQPLPPESIAYIRFPAAAAEPFRAGFVRRVLLADGQQITARLLAADGDALSLRTAWAGRVDVPRSAVVALRQPPGFQSMFEDDFSDGLRAWTVAGKPLIDGDPPAAALTASGQGLAFAPPDPPDAGRVGVNFRDGDAAGARWSVNLRFKGDGEPRTLRVTLAGPGDAYEVEPSGLDGDGRRVARSAGWHRLTVRFSRESLSVLCDDGVLWSNLRQGPGGTLRQVSLNCTPEAKSDAVRGRVEFTEFSLSRAVDEPRRPAGDAAQEEVWLADGDQLFGDALHIDRRAVEIQGAFGKRWLPWSGVRGCWFRRNGAVRAPTQPGSPGARVRLWIDSGLDPEPDVLEGILKAIDDKQATLQHPALGELHIPRERLRRLRPLPS